MFICGYQNEILVIDGIILLIFEVGWEFGENGIYSVKIDQDIWQLFVDGEMMINV